MPITPGKFTGTAKIQPVGGAGKVQAQQPNPPSSSKKQGALLRQLEETKLEGDPLNLWGNGAERSIPGDNPAPPYEAVSSGDRLTLWDGEIAGVGTNEVTKVAFGVDGDRTFWFQSTGLQSSDTEVAGFDWYTGGPATNDTLRRTMRLTDIGQMVLSQSDPVQNARLTIEFGAISVGHSEVSNGGTLSVGIATGAVIIGDATGGACTVNLPPAADSEGCTITAKRVNGGANAVVVDGNGAETIDGAATKTLGSQYACLVVYCDGIEWHVVSTFGTVT